MILLHSGTHLAERNKVKCDEGCAMLGIDETMLLAVVQDTTASSLNTYTQLRCGGHTIELVSQRTTEGTAVEIGLDRIQDCLRRARGNKSIARREMLEKYAAEEECKYTKVYLPCVTRWGGRVLCADNLMTYVLLYKRSKMKIVRLTIVKKPSRNYLMTQCFCYQLFKRLYQF